MKIDLTSYRHLATITESVCKNNPYAKDDIELISLISIASGAPVIAAAYYYAAYIKNLNANIQKNIDNLIKFYGYTEITGINEVLGDLC
ncbi:MAG: hypothetical protein EB127_21740 [Alphaproteobacteria bacterium]|nr:hypothetical protein [Alphaproteobacteria bacterium]